MRDAVIEAMLDDLGEVDVLVRAEHREGKATRYVATRKGESSYLGSGTYDEAVVEAWEVYCRTGEVGAVVLRAMPLDLAVEVDRELIRARSKFPSSYLALAALTEEVGELAKAAMDESLERVRAEAVQVIVMATRIVTEGDPSINLRRRRAGVAEFPVGASS